METRPEVPTPLTRREYPADALMHEHPPLVGHANKQIVLDIACPPGAIHWGTLEYTRWTGMAMPPIDGAPDAVNLVAVRDGFFSYEPFLEPGAAVEWHVNFADTHLFGYYAGGHFAQDEMQVAEHPVLAAVREAILAEGLPALTIDRGEATPVLVAGAERRVRIATEPNAAEGRPEGLYGRRFRESSPGPVRRAVTVIDPPTTTNVIAIAALSYGHDAYTAEQIRWTLGTAFTGFRAAVLESARMAGAGVPVVVHSGFWGAGAFGGNAALMTAIQVLAARTAGLDRLVYYAGNPSRLPSLEQGLEAVKQLPPDTMSADDLAERLAAMGFRWRSSDGN